jgi:tetratricopeptide (TPR) repeat protein
VLKVPLRREQMFNSGRRLNAPMPDRGGATEAEEPAAGLLPGSLSAEDHRLLAYASAIGSEFDFQLLTAATGIAEEELAEELERLVHRGYLRERVGGDRFAFAEEEIRARIYRSLTESRLRVLHRKIAAAMETLGGPGGPEQYADLGRHYFLGKVPEKSLEYNRRAAEQARGMDEPIRAVHHYERVLLDLASLPGDHRRETTETLQTLGDLYYSISDFAGSDRYYSDALEKTPIDEPGLTARLLLARAEIARESLEGDSAARGAVEARRLFETAGDTVGVAQTYRLVARLAFQRGDYQEALDANMCALELLEGNHDPRLIGRLSIDIGNAFALLGPDVRSIAVEWYERAIDRLARAGDWVELSRAYHNMGVLVGDAQPQDGLEYLTRAREAADRAQDARSSAWSLLSGVEMRLGLGQIEEAHRDNDQAARLLQRLSDDLGLEQVTLNRGEIAERRGQWDEAEKQYLAAIADCQRFRLKADESEVQFRLARLRSKTRDWAGARAAFARAGELGLVSVRPNLAGAYRELQRVLEAEDASASERPAL